MVFMEARRVELQCRHLVRHQDKLSESLGTFVDGLQTLVFIATVAT